MAAFHQGGRQRRLAVAAAPEQQHRAGRGSHGRRVQRRHAALLQQNSPESHQENGDVGMVAAKGLDAHVAAVGYQIAGHAFHLHEEGAGARLPHVGADQAAGTDGKGVGNGAETHGHVPGSLRVGQRIEGQRKGGADAQPVGAIARPRQRFVQPHSSGVAKWTPPAAWSFSPMAQLVW